MFFGQLLIGITLTLQSSMGYTISCSKLSSWIDQLNKAPGLTREEKDLLAKIHNSEWEFLSPEEKHHLFIMLKTLIKELQYASLSADKNSLILSSQSHHLLKNLAYAEFPKTSGKTRIPPHIFSRLKELSQLIQLNFGRIDAKGPSVPPKETSVSDSSTAISLLPNNAWITPFVRTWLQSSIPFELPGKFKKENKSIYVYSKNSDQFWIINMPKTILRVRELEATIKKFHSDDSLTPLEAAKQDVTPISIQELKAIREYLEKYIQMSFYRFIHPELIKQVATALHSPIFNLINATNSATPHHSSEALTLGSLKKKNLISYLPSHGELPEFIESAKTDSVLPAIPEGLKNYESWRTRRLKEALDVLFVDPDPSA